MIKTNDLIVALASGEELTPKARIEAIELLLYLDKQDTILSSIPFFKVICEEKEYQVRFYSYYCFQIALGDSSGNLLEIEKCTKPNGEPFKLGSLV